MKVGVNFDALIREREVSKKMTQRFRARCKKLVRLVSLDTKAQMQFVMPVDTGAARARWGTKGAPGGLWEVSDEGMTIAQGGQLEPFEYIERLNEGSSQQAPAGFMDTIAYKMQLLLEEWLADELLKAFNEQYDDFST